MRVRRSKFGIPEHELARIRARDKRCVYCRKEMTSVYSGKHRDYATIEHLNFDGPFYWEDGLQAEDVVICCGSCNSSRGVKTLSHWFASPYCIQRNISAETVAQPVKEYLRRNYER
jgi:hypothetical protein